MCSPGLSTGQILSHLRLVSLCISSGSSRSLFPLRFISATERMCAQEKFGFLREIRSSRLFRGIFIWYWCQQTTSGAGAYRFQCRSISYGWKSMSPVNLCPADVVDGILVEDGFHLLLNSPNILLLRGSSVRRHVFEFPLPSIEQSCACGNDYGQCSPFERSTSPKRSPC